MLSREAMELLEDSSWHGDHEFEHEQLDAWQEQRGALLIGLALVAADAAVSDADWARIAQTRCPRTVAEEYITEEHEVTHRTSCSECGERIEHETTEEEEVPNPDYSNGTDDGAGWVDAARSLIQRAMQAERDTARAIASSRA